MTKRGVGDGASGLKESDRFNLAGMAAEFRPTRPEGRSAAILVVQTMLCPSVCRTLELMVLQRGGHGTGLALSIFTHTELLISNHELIPASPGQRDRARWQAHHPEG